MADEIAATAAPASPTPAATPAVVEAAVASAAPAPAADATAQPAAEVPAVASTEAPATAEVKPAEAAPAAAAKPEDAKPAEVAPADGEAKPAEVAVDPAAAPKAPEFKLPENIKADAATMSAYANVLTKYGISPEAGQELIDFHANTVKAASEHMSQHQQDVWAETQATWVADFDKSAGNKRDTILNDAKFAITDSVKDAAQRKEVWDVLAFTGAGNNKAVINALASIGKRLRERSAPSAGVPGGTGKGGNPADRRYGGKQA